MKVFCLTIFVSFFFKNRNDDREAQEYLNENSIQLNNRSKCSLKNERNRLTKDEIKISREFRLKEIEMWAILRETFTSILFLILLCFIVYSNRNFDPYLQVRHLKKFFLKNSFEKILTVEDYWNWIERKFVSNLRAQEWYNGDIPRYLNGFLNDKTNRLIGWGIMRQLRIQSHPCLNQKILSICHDDYHFFNEEQNSFNPGRSMNN